MTYLPKGFPTPEHETVEALRHSILAKLRTPFPPLPDELAVIICADQAGVDLSAVDPEALWHSSPEERAPVFSALGRLLGEVVG